MMLAFHPPGFWLVLCVVELSLRTEQSLQECRLGLVQVASKQDVTLERFFLEHNFHVEARNIKNFTEYRKKDVKNCVLSLFLLHKG
jgi:hypothetical protein